MNRFDRFADHAAGIVSHARFFIFCVLMVVIWLPSILLIRNFDTWQLIINTTTTIITFLMVAILENTARQFEASTNVKLDAILDAVGRGEVEGVEGRMGTDKPKSSSA